MLFAVEFGLWISMFRLLLPTTGLSYNQPKFCHSATWNPIATTFSDINTTGVNPYGLFVNTNNSVYVADKVSGRVQVWLEGNSTPIKILYGGMTSPYAIFVNTIGDIYVDNGFANGRVDVWTPNAANSTTAMYVNGICHGLFIDINDNLHCSLGDFHKVVKKLFNDSTNTSTIVAGNGTNGSQPNMLDNPHAIFINTEFDLYVADRDNHRIQLFRSGQLDGITVAGNGAPGTPALAYPTGIVLDGNGYLFISDTNNNRIIGSGANGFRCIVGCSGVNGIGSDQLNFPWSISFDSYGNLFVADAYNSRIQKFNLATNCDPSYNQPKLCPSATWNPIATTFSDINTIGVNPYGLFVNTNNSVYVADKVSGRVQVWLEGNSTPIEILYGGMTSPYAIFVNTIGDIYVDNGFANGRVDVWAPNAANSTTAMYVNGICHGLFIDINDNLHCSLGDFHKVVKKLFNDSTNTSTIVAGNGTSGLESHMLNQPHGIFINTEFDLYVADRDNHRIQLFRSGQLDGITVAGQGTSGAITLQFPTGIVLDGNGYLFISDTNNNRIIGSGPNGFRCIIGCSSVAGIGSDQLNFPWGISFDSYGNLFVGDAYNSRIQKFNLATNCDPSYNQPKLCPSATWNPIATTFSDINTTGVNPYGLFVNTNNTVYVAARSLNHIYVWSEGHISPTRTITGDFFDPFAIFVTITDDLYVDNGGNKKRVDRWTSNATNSDIAMYVNGSCFGLFIDSNDILHCSLTDFHRVIKKLFNDTTYSSTIVAGNGTSGSDSHTLNQPRGIFINTNFDLYVADFQNHRIQLFRSGQLDGITVAGNGAPGTPSLAYPTGIVLDGNGYLFISDTNHNRIIGSDANGFRCIVGCLQTNGYNSDELNTPWSISFDSYGNLFVADAYNNRIQKFFLATNCDADTTMLTLTTTDIQKETTYDTLSTVKILQETTSDVQFITTAFPEIFYDTQSTTTTIQETTHNIQSTRKEPEDTTYDIQSTMNIISTTNQDIQSTGRTSQETTYNIQSTTNIISTTNQDIQTTRKESEDTTYDIQSTPKIPSTANHDIQSTGRTSQETTYDIQSTTNIVSTTNQDIQSTRKESDDTTYDTQSTPKIPSTANHDIRSTGRTSQETTYDIQSTTNIPSITTQDIQSTRESFQETTYKFQSTKNISSTTDQNVQSSTTALQESTSTMQSTMNTVPETTNDMGSTTEITQKTTHDVQSTMNIGQETSYVAQSTINVAQETTNVERERTTVQETTNAIRTTISIKNFSANIIEPTADQTTIQFSKERSPASTTIIPTSTSNISNANRLSCSLPTIILIPGTSTLFSPAQFRRNQDFYMTSNIQFSCNTSLSTSIQWTISNCTSTTCPFEIQIDPSVVTTLRDLYIPARTLSYGIYELKMTVSVVASLNLISSASAYVKITPSGVTANLVQFGTSMITRGHKQDLLLDPGTFSVDPDRTFNASEWQYEYYCRIYNLYNFPNILGSLLSIDDFRTDPLNPSCISNQLGNGTPWQYGGVSASPKSSVMILSGSLLSNQTYQFMVYMENRRNFSLHTTGYLLVTVVDIPSQLVVIACVISTMCVPNMEFQLVNPTTQVALSSICLGNCSSLINTTWNIYQGSNASLLTVQWRLFNQNIQYQDIWFFGTNTSNFTATDELFINNPSVVYWRFEVVYSFVSRTSSSALNFAINHPPRNGSCSISPLNGMTTTLFTISCPNWFDEDDIKDYSLYSYTTDRSNGRMIAFSTISEFDVRLPYGDDNTSILNLFIYIRDTLDCITKFNLTSVIVTPDSLSIMDLIKALQSSSRSLTNNSIVQLLLNGNQNTIAQVLTSVSQQLNKMNIESLQTAVSNGIPAASISISPLGSPPLQGIPVPLNESALIEYNKQLNSYAYVCDYLMTFITNLSIMTSESIILLASAIAQLTQSTNQLTRSSAVIASEKCYQLARSLYSMSTQITYEDVQTAATQIIECTSNVLTAINAPLQERTIVLDLDSSRANTFPQDYDTDLESEWSNLNLFADGNDFSYEAIEKGRNLYNQKQIAQQISGRATGTISLLTAALNIHLNIGQKLVVNASSVFMSLETILVKSLANKIIQPLENAQIHLPSSFNTSINNEQIVSLRSILRPLASSDESQLKSHTNLSTSIALSILDRDENELSIQTTLDHPYQFIIPRDPNVIIPPMTLQNVTLFNSASPRLLFNLHYVNLVQSNNLPISIHIDVKFFNTSFAYLFIYKFDTSPRLNSSIQQINGWSLFCPANLPKDNFYTYFINNQLTTGHQSLIFGLRELNSTEMNTYCSNQSISNPPISDKSFNFTSSYQLRVYTSGCYYLDSKNNWQSDGLLVGPLTSHTQTQCFSTCPNTFAGGFFLLPSPINWNYVFSNANFTQNKTIYLTVIWVSILYILLIIYARYKDKQDIEKLGVTASPDNYKADKYCYQIIVFTGHRRGAGTESKVQFLIAGERGETKARTFSDPKRKIFQRGGIDAFVVTVPKSLGPLNYIYIWHDNSGQGSSSSWFLKYIIVRDLQTLEKSYFICQRWLAVEKDNGRLDRVLPVAGDLQKHAFSYALSKQAYHSVADEHLWFSIFSRPPSTRFTRVQRCTCCFVLLFISMFLNIMYYDQVKEALSNNTNSAGFSLGPLYITFKQMQIGVIVEALALIPSLLLVQFFRRLQPVRFHQQQISSLSQTLHEIKQKSIPKISINATNKKQSQLMFPWWCIFLAYSLSFLLAVVSIFFVIGRGIEFGDLVVQKWLISSVTSLFSSILLTQPLQILLMAVFFACCIRDSDKVATEYLENSGPFNLGDDEEYLHSIKDNSPFSHRCKTRVSRLDANEIAFKRAQRMKELKMWSIIRETLIYACFIAVLHIVIYSNVNSSGFYQVKHLQQFLLNPREISQDYTKISTVSEYWNWLEESFVGNIRAQKWYNGGAPRNLSGFLNDKTNRLIGWATMRQLRVRLNQCHIKSDLFSVCEVDYNFSNEEKRSFKPGWNNQTTLVYSSAIQQAFKYQSGDELDSYIYLGKHAKYNSGGYVYQFRGRLSYLQSNLSQLQQLDWINSQTRAVMIQLNLYNPNVELFTSITLLVEFLSTGGLDSQFHFEPLSFQMFTSTTQLVSSIVYMIIIIYMMIQQVQSIVELKMKYFCQFWSYVDVGTIICSWIGVGIYMWRYAESKRIGNLFKETNGYVYVNLQLAVSINDVLIYLIGFCCFFGWIRLIRLCRFSRRLSLFIETLQHAGKDLLSFSFMFSILFVAFMFLFFLLFVSKLSKCSSLLSTSQMLFEMILMKFDAHDLIDASSVLGPICFSLFILLVVFICLSVFITIIIDSFRFVRDDAKRHQNDNEKISAFMIRKFRYWIGKQSISEIIEENEEIMRSKYYDPVEHFPDKIDQLLDALNRIYINQPLYNSKE